MKTNDKGTPERLPCVINIRESFLFYKTEVIALQGNALIDKKRMPFLHLVACSKRQSFPRKDFKDFSSAHKADSD